MHLQSGRAVANAEGEFCAVGDYGPTVRDMNTSDKTDPPKL